MVRRREGRRRFSKKHKSKRRFPKRKYSLFQRLNYFSRRHPIVVGVLLITASIVLFRLSFTHSFLSKTEVVMWTWLVSIGLFIGGLLTLSVWFKRNVPQLFTKHNVNWRNR